MEDQKTAIIIGAGPAGLTAAYELLQHTDIRPIVLEAGKQPGGIAKTIDYQGYKMDLGGHRFFSKSDRVMDWWQQIMPIQGGVDQEINIQYQGKEKHLSIPEGPDPEQTDKVFLLRNRQSRIYYGQQFYDYPVKLNFQTISNLGLFRTLKIGMSYAWSLFFPIRKEQTLEDFLINRFGKELYQTFFKDYTEKVWGKSCKEIPSEWGAQRIKGLSVTKVMLHSFKKLFSSSKDLAQKGHETSLIEQFIYPKYGPGQLWEEVVKQIEAKGGEVEYGVRVSSLACRQAGIESEKGKVISVEAEGKRYNGDYFFSTMAVKDLLEGMNEVPVDALQVAQQLEYRDFIAVGLLLEKMHVKNKGSYQKMIQDNWIYIQDASVKAGRLQIFNNWSPYMISDPSKVWIGVEYFCNQGDELWEKSAEELKQLAVKELSDLGLILPEDFIDGVVEKMPKTYPAYFGAYKDFHKVRDFTDSLENLFLIGRNGMHKYNNQDHSMLTAMEAVQNIVHGKTSKENIWSVNTEQEYHEES